MFATLMSWFAIHALIIVVAMFEYKGKVDFVLFSRAHLPHILFSAQIFFLLFLYPLLRKNKRSTRGGSQLSRHLITVLSHFALAVALIALAMPYVLISADLQSRPAWTVVYAEIFVVIVAGLASVVTATSQIARPVFLSRYYLVAAAVCFGPVFAYYVTYELFRVSLKTLATVSPFVFLTKLAPSTAPTSILAAMGVVVFLLCFVGFIYATGRKPGRRGRSEPSLEGE